MAASPPTGSKPIPATRSPTANADAPTPRPRTTPPSASPPTSNVAGATDGTTATAADTNKPASRARRRLKRPARELIPAPSSGAAESPVPTAAEQDQPPPSRRRLEGSHPAGVSRAVISQ
ncbi:unnamed protein product [Danaus chrysippus]|uniref:(African queen) hypothetical protein n=1 Tax=Danaus chrysippus TaxID=151541 RepID=A0A8J2QWC6_9NEOP|nr:unnamed protein product [Danaus chrysippus]